ncbi:MAG: hypothetical protein GF397_04910 [Elusimicrobia bacterium]|nr:hypothetical protein [Elusimicrobiota bacterium]
MGIFASRDVSVTGTRLTLEQARERARKALSQGEEYFMTGPHFKALGKRDPRVVEYRFYQENGEPTAIEVYVIMRDSNRKAKPAKSIKVPWPYEEGEKAAASEKKSTTKEKSKKEEKDTSDDIKKKGKGLFKKFMK